MSSKNGILLVDKPQGPTSHDMVALARKRIRTREIGHAGTLDPMATGVLVLCVGEGTKLVPYLTAHSKVYECTIRFGVETDSLDAMGRTVREIPCSSALKQHLAQRSEAIFEAIRTEQNRKEQVPPSVSAIHVQGVRAHQLVREGHSIELPPREVHVDSIELLETHEQSCSISLRVHCSKGYYVRSLARDFATHFQTVGHLTALRRIRSGPFSISDCVSLNQTDSPLSLLSIADVLRSALPCATLSPEGVRKATHGKQLVRDDVLSDVHTGNQAWFDEQGTWVAIGFATFDEHNQWTGKVLRGAAAQ